MGRADGSDRRVTSGPVNDDNANILHVDMDAFFASVELLDNPHARGKPAVVGHTGGRGVVTSATYEARKYGIRSAMPVSQARRLCPQLIILPPHHEKYTHISRAVMAIFRDVTPLVEPISIDEAFLDVAGARRLFGSSHQIAVHIRQRVKAETGLTCSVGIAGTKFMAKLASSRAKPDGILVIPPSETLTYLRPLAVGQLWGVGRSTAQSLQSLGITTVNDIAECPLPVLERAVGAASARILHDLAHGIDPRAVVTESAEKSIGHEHTFAQDVSDRDVLRRELLRLSVRVGERLRHSGEHAQTVSLKIRFDDFRTLTRSRTLTEATSVGRRLFEVGWDLFLALGIDLSQTAIRLIGIRAENLRADGAGNLPLWDPDAAWRDAEHALDGVVTRFGAGKVGPASLLARSREADAEERDGRNPTWITD